MISLVLLILRFSYRFVTGGDPDPEKIKVEADKLAKKLDVYEEILSKQSYIAGDVCPAASALGRIDLDLSL